MKPKITKKRSNITFDLLSLNIFNNYFTACLALTTIALKASG